MDQKHNELWTAGPDPQKLIDEQERNKATALQNANEADARREANQAQVAGRPRHGSPGPS